MTELRKRMIEDMELAGFAPATHDAYIRAVRQLAAHFRVSPDRLTESQLREYLLHLRNVRSFSKGAFQQHFFALRFLFVNTLAYSWPLFTQKKSACPFASAFPTCAATRTAAA
jgi:integrase/recombinase XerD